VINANVGITPKLFIAAVLKLYGFIAAKMYIQDSFADLSWVNDTLINVESKLLKEDPRDKKQQKFME
jgi:hypothetical protein